MDVWQKAWVSTALSYRSTRCTGMQCISMGVHTSLKQLATLTNNTRQLTVCCACCLHFYAKATAVQSKIHLTTLGPAHCSAHAVIALPRRCSISKCCSHKMHTCVICHYRFTCCKWGHPSATRSSMHGLQPVLYSALVPSLPDRRSSLHQEPKCCGSADAGL